MNTDTFMNLLFIVLAITLMILLIFRFLGHATDMKRPRLYKPFTIDYVRSAWGVFPNFVNFGLLLSAIALCRWIIYLAGLYGSLRFTPGEFDPLILKEQLNRNTANFGQYLNDLIKLAPGALFDSTWRISKIIDVTLFPISVFVLSYLLRKLSQDADQAIERRFSSFSKFLLYAGILLLVIEAVYLVLIFYLFEQAEYWINISSGASPFLSVVEDALGLFAASIVEGAFLYILFDYYQGRYSGLKPAINKSLDVLPALFVFNLCYFALPPFIVNLVQMIFGFTVYTSFVTSYGKGFLNSTYVDAAVWFLRMVFFLTPFIIIKEGSGLNVALKKNIIAVLRAPVDYFVLFVGICAASLALETVLELSVKFIVNPILLNFDLVIIAANTSLVSSIVFVWFSMFVYCVFGVFAREKFLYEEI